jgi:UDP-N-acetylglucosamine transferase subunit ALG13
MTEGKDEKLRRKFRILVAPLDWGLGHATRCIPIIKELLGNDCDVWLAGEGPQETLLRSEFPHQPFLSLAGYNIEYSRTSGGLLLKLLLQLPQVLSSIRAEHRWLNRSIKIHGFDAVISDNRFGLYHSYVPSVFITHQLSIKSPLGKWNERILRKWNYKYINRFKECWVPDLVGENNLAGELSHPMTMPRSPVKYIDVLSRFEKKEEREIKDQLLFILSGPEPQRTILENKIINEVCHYPGTATIVRGLPSMQSVIPSTGMIKFYNHLSAKELNEEIEKADWVISRSGYSTIMDLAKLQKKSILIPTPGQTEQEYLAKELWQKRIAFGVEQKEFYLSPVLEEAKKFNCRFSLKGNWNGLNATVKSFLDSLR